MTKRQWFSLRIDFYRRQAQIWFSPVERGHQQIIVSPPPLLTSPGNTTLHVAVTGHRGPQVLTQATMVGHRVTCQRCAVGAVISARPTWGGEGDDGGTVKCPRCPDIALSVLGIVMDNNYLHIDWKSNKKQHRLLCGCNYSFGAGGYDMSPSRQPSRKITLGSDDGTRAAHAKRPCRARVRGFIRSELIGLKPFSEEPSRSGPPGGFRLGANK